MGHQDVTIEENEVYRNSIPWCRKWPILLQNYIDIYVQCM